MIYLDSIPLQILLQVILILVNAFFAASEIAVISLNTALLNKKIEEGDKRAERLLKLNNEPSDFLSTIQIAITLSGFLGSAFAADNFSEYLVNWLVYDLGITSVSYAVLDTVSVILITIILSFFTLVFGELVPKRMAMHNPYGMACFSSGVIIFIKKIMKPVIVLLSFCTNMVLKLFGIKEKEDDEVSEEEIKMMVDMGEKSGSIEKDESEWIQNIFEFNDIEVREIMTHRVDVVTVRIDDDYEDIVNTFKRSGRSRLPVYDHEQKDIIGLLYVRDLFLNSKEKDISKLMRKPYFTPENIKADTLFETMRKNNFHFGIVVDEYGGFSGIITMEDLMEAIVGNIYDEYDADGEDEELRKIDDNHYVVKGSISLEDLYEETGIASFKNEIDEYDTISGLVTGTLNCIPDIHATVEMEDCLIEVLEVKRHRITKLYITKKRSE